MRMVVMQMQILWDSNYGFSTDDTLSDSEVVWSSYWSYNEDYRTNVVDVSGITGNVYFMVHMSGYDRYNSGGIYIKSLQLN